MTSNASSQENVVFFNGQILPEKDVGIPIRDRGFIYGDAVFDATRTFGGKTFKLREHIHRLYNSLKYLRIDPGMTPEEMERWSLEVVNHNYPLLPAGQDMWVMQRISRGVESSEPGAAMRPTVLIESHAIPFARRAIPVPGRDQCSNPFGTPDTAPLPQSPGQDPQLPEPDNGRPGGAGHRPQRLVGIVGRGRQLDGRDGAATSSW